MRAHQRQTLCFQSIIGDKSDVTYLHAGTDWRLKGETMTRQRKKLEVGSECSDGRKNNHHLLDFFSAAKQTPTSQI